MNLVRMEEISLEIGERRILTDVSFTIEPGERVCLIGQNGAGKTTLLKLISGELHPDHGTIEYKSDLGIATLAQDLPEAMDQTVAEVVAEGLAPLRRLIERYERQASLELDKAGMRELEALHRRIDALDAWHLEQKVDSLVSELRLPAGKRMRELSGGWRRRVALARALASGPDLLLLDEPTNHLDIATISWLEDRIFGFSGAVLFVTHDRAFLQRLATRIVDLDRGRLVSWPGNYRQFLDRKEKALADELAANREFDKKLAEEEIWIRQGIKARRHRNENRVRALKAMREQRANRLGRPDRARISIESGDASGRKVIRLHKVSHGYGDQTLIRDFSMKIMRGDRIGLIGNNGVGKSTLLRILLGEITPRQGTVKHGTNLEIGYFDQLRETLEMDKSVAHNVGEGRDYISINGRNRHVIGYLRGFLFSAKRAMMPVKALSGGERNRVILARLFTRPTNLLILDEPTNDLDVETLEVLEQRLVDYDGTLIVVSHDREFLDNVVTSILVFEEDGQIREYVGGYSDWERRGHRLREVDRPDQSDQAPVRKDEVREEEARKDEVPQVAAPGAADGARTPRGARKLSYKDQRELALLPAKIEALEAEIADLTTRASAPGFYDQPFDQVQPVLDALAERNAELEQRTARWLELEEQAESRRERR